MLVKSTSTILSEPCSQTTRAVMPQNDTVVATASKNTIKRTPKVEPAGVRRLAFASPLFTQYVYEVSVEEIREKDECFEEILINRRARQLEVAYFHVYGHWPEDVKPTEPTSNPPQTVREPPSKARKKGPLRRSKRIAALKKKNAPLRRSPRIASMKIKPKYQD